MMFVFFWENKDWHLMSVYSHEISSFLGATAFENMHFRVNVYKVCCINKRPNHFTWSAQKSISLEVE